MRLAVPSCCDGRLRPLEGDTEVLVEPPWHDDIDIDDESEDLDEGVHVELLHKTFAPRLIDHSLSYVGVGIKHVGGSCGLKAADVMSKSTTCACLPPSLTRATTPTTQATSVCDEPDGEEQHVTPVHRPVPLLLPAVVYVRLAGWLTSPLWMCPLRRWAAAHSSSVVGVPEARPTEEAVTAMAGALLSGGISISVFLALRMMGVNVLLR
ncbi:unnamed protein product [Vitrella brassicaformis CCMP3155]|uniref:Uncharacterized protein n=2 Tax=Vitrella brassicaformis TaxID=1169539 RepID=A0A0G4FK83_VITBC|nr:unnamed protein product [Vitrella brassicaformis CCMP3155]|mmetsp:Transcript_29782/g.74093  ORF Transcript_29782/g.74093 Transcript_29782/m.74093 type:complete len:209 (+) Transcript_29782:135-761(+)|eukprot:CEM14196.1 unnamed protein product [Vitrella brassicaformis CCMP3155]